MRIVLASSYKNIQKSDQSKSNCGVTVSTLTQARVKKRADIFR